MVFFINTPQKYEKLLETGSFKRALNRHKNLIFMQKVLRKIRVIQKTKSYGKFSQ